MKYFFNISINGEIDGKSDDGQPESLADIQRLVSDSFKPDLLAGVSVRSLNISVHEAPSMPPVAQGAGSGAIQRAIPQVEGKPLGS